MQDRLTSLPIKMGAQHSSFYITEAVYFTSKCTAQGYVISHIKAVSF